MKTLRNLIAGAVLSAAFMASAALPDPQNYFQAYSTNEFTAAGHCIVGPRSGNGGPPVVTALAYAIDAAQGARLIRGYLVTTNVTCTNGNSFGSATAVYFGGGAAMSNNFAAGDNVVYYHAGNDLCERRIVSTVLLTNIMTFTVALNVAPTNGDVIYRVTNFNAPKIAIGGGGSNIISSTAPIMVGQAGKPLLIDVPGQTAGGALSAAGFYAAPPNSANRP